MGLVLWCDVACLGWPENSHATDTLTQMLIWRSNIVNLWKCIYALTGSSVLSHRHNWHYELKLKTHKMFQQMLVEVSFNDLLCECIQMILFVMTYDLWLKTYDCCAFCIHIIHTTKFSISKIPSAFGEILHFFLWAFQVILFWQHDCHHFLMVEKTLRRYIQVQVLFSSELIENLIVHSIATFHKRF